MKNELRIQRLIIVVLIGLTAFLGLRPFYFRERITIPSDIALVRPPANDLPHYDKIMDILAPLEYSGIVDVLKPEVKLKVNFMEKTWTLTNIHKFDSQGNVKLDSNRYGLCGELSAHTYLKIAPLLEDRFDILFVKAVESGFFLTPKSTHIVLMLSDKATKKRYFIDPSFQRYGSEADFADYLFFVTATPKTHLDSLKKDETFPADSAAPLLMRKNFLLSLGIEFVEQKFDKNNFALSVTANKRHEYSGRYALAYQKINGKTQVFENDHLLSQLLTSEEIKKIRNRMAAWIESVTQDA